ncbi:MAG: hypothetical protein AAF430_21655 [Myxococcota bacterium]
MRLAGGLLLAVLFFGLSGCVTSDPLGHAYALKEAQKRYTKAIRWGDLEMAARYVDPELRKDFLALASPFEQVRITDYEIGELDVEEEELTSAEVDVTYRGYVLPHFVEHRVLDRQVWTREEGMSSVWRVAPDLPALMRGLSGADG